LVNTGLGEPEKEETANVHFASAREAKAFADLGNEMVSRTVSAICGALPEGGVVFTRDGAIERLTKPCADNGISVVSRVMDSDMKALSRLLHDAPIVHEGVNVDAGCVTECISIRQESIGGMKFVVVEQPPDECPVSTLVLRGATRQTLDEHERGFQDAIGVVSLAFRDGKVVCGGGSAYISMAQHLRQRAADMGGREQMAVEAFAEALEIIPATIAENAGHDPLDTILGLRNDHQNNKEDYGPDVDTGGTCSMTEKGVFEPLSVITQAVQSAAEVAISILRIDDIISKRMG